MIWGQNMLEWSWLTFKVVVELFTNSHHWTTSAVLGPNDRSHACPTLQLPAFPEIPVIDVWCSAYYHNHTGYLVFSYVQKYYKLTCLYHSCLVYLSLLSCRNLDKNNLAGKWMNGSDRIMIDFIHTLTFPIPPLHAFAQTLLFIVLSPTYASTSSGIGGPSGLL